AGVAGLRQGAPGGSRRTTVVAVVTGKAIDVVVRSSGRQPDQGPEHYQQSGLASWPAVHGRSPVYWRARRGGRVESLSISSAPLTPSRPQSGDTSPSGINASLTKCPIRSRETLIVVSAGHANADRPMLSQPTTATPPGILSPRSRSALSTPKAMKSLTQTMAVGLAPDAKSCCVARWPPEGLSSSATVAYVAPSPQPRTASTKERSRTCSGASAVW